MPLCDSLWFYYYVSTWSWNWSRKYIVNAHSWFTIFVNFTVSHSVTLDDSLLLPTKRNDKFHPSTRVLPEFKFWSESWPFVTFSCWTIANCLCHPLFNHARIICERRYTKDKWILFVCICLWLYPVWSYKLISCT